MRRKRTGAGEDSLDLLLDTVSNMFGGIMFIAILVSLFTGAREAFDSSAEGDRRSAYEVLRLEGRVREEKSRVEGLDAATDAMTEVGKLAEGRSSEDLERILGNKEEEFRRLIGEAELRLSAAKETEKRLAEKARSLSHRIEDADAQTLKLDKEAVRLQAELEAAKKARVVEARLPKEESTGKHPVNLILMNKKIFQVFMHYDKETGMPSRDLTENDDVAISQLAQGRLRAIPRDNLGFPVTSAIASHPRWKRLVGEISAKKHFLEIVLFPDSYEEFRLFQETILRAGFAYNVGLATAGQPVEYEVSNTFKTQ